MTNAKTRVVLAGCGGITGAWLDAAATKERVEIVGLVDLRREAAEEMARRRQYAGAVVDTDLAAVLKATSPDVVYD
jgi:predicted dehydrogenase